MALQSLCPTVTLENAKEDYRTAKRVEQYRMGQDAIYLAAFPGTKYLPFSGLERAWIQSSSISLKGCCGKELPVTVLRTQYEGGFFQNITFEKAESAELVLKNIRQKRPDLPGIPKRDPA